MRRQRDPLLDFRFSDAATFLAVRRHGSLSAASRELGVTPSQVSKAIVRLEKQLNVTLLKRSPHGVEVSLDAVRIAPLIELAIARVRDARNDDGPHLPVLTMAGPSYVMATLSGAMARALPQMRIRVLQLAPAEIRGMAARGLFDVAFSVGEPFVLDSWDTVAAGQLQRALFATPEVARRLGPAPVDVERVKRERFVSPVSQSDGQSAPLDDGCPIPYAQRRRGHEAQTLALALELAVASGQVVFGPVSAAIGRVLAGQLVPVEVKGWALSEPMHVMVNVDRVTAPVRTAVLKEARAFVADAQLGKAVRLRAPKR
jgi:DNA-binding transcriptional LysR family regulator